MDPDRYMHTLTVCTSPHLLRDCPNVGESFPEDNKDTLSPTAQCRRGTVKGSVSSPQHQHHSLHRWQLTLALTHTFRRKHMGYINISGGR